MGGPPRGKNSFCSKGYPNEEDFQYGDYVVTREQTGMAFNQGLHYLLTGFTIKMGC